MKLIFNIKYTLILFIYSLNLHKKGYMFLQFVEDYIFQKNGLLKLILGIKELHKSKIVCEVLSIYRKIKEY